MPSGPHAPIATPLATMVTEQPRHNLRLRLKPKAPTSGYVDGAWWPRSRDLSIELPTLLAVLAVRLDRVERVTYNLTAWNPASRRLAVDGGGVRLDGFRSQHSDTVTVIGAGGRRRLTLLVVAPDTGSAVARRVLVAAARRDNADSVEALLAATGVADTMDAATQRWEVDGGRVNDRVPASSP
ncbi:DUF5994 family protein [Amycolatopsis anabasis]|uniref:DUF5994 family protein n=1 Tax=Amycolatopsis anabasis TaxID=1840409 RepID=UPI001FE3C604|nr:DUF5994 family protein [Amycolatopsis anabasis]